MNQVKVKKYKSNKCTINEAKSSRKEIVCTLNDNNNIIDNNDLYRCSL